MREITWGNGDKMDAETRHAVKVIFTVRRRQLRDKKIANDCSCPECGTWLPFTEEEAKETS
jgi:hypothetical protein